MKLSEIIKYLKILFLILWIFGIFIGGKFMYFLITIFGLHTAITFRQSGIDVMEWQKKLHKFFGRKFDVSNFDIFFSQAMSLFGGIVMLILGLVKLFS